MDWRRNVFVFLAHSALALTFIHRFILSVAIIPMVGVGKSTKNARPNTTNVARTSEGFKWDQAQQGIILSAFFYGYIPLQIPAGILVERYGGSYE